jgi:hypothetical protein
VHTTKNSCPRISIPALLAAALAGFATGNALQQSVSAAGERVLLPDHGAQVERGSGHRAKGG